MGFELGTVLPLTGFDFKICPQAPKVFRHFREAGPCIESRIESDESLLRWSFLPKFDCVIIRGIFTDKSKSGYQIV